MTENEAREKEAADSKRADSEPRERVSRRSLSVEQQERFLEILSASPKGDVLIYCTSASPDACEFAEQLKDLLDSIGWKVAGVYPEVHSSPVEGLILIEQLPDTPRAVALQKALHAVGLFSVREANSAWMYSGGLALTVGNKR